MARPKIDPMKRRTAQVSVAVSPAELAALQEKADRAGMNVTAFTRASALSRKLPAPSTASPVDFETRAELRRIGTNLNQIAKAMNAGRDGIPASLTATCQKLDALFDRIMPDGSQGHISRPQL